MCIYAAKSWNSKKPMLTRVENVECMHIFLQIVMYGVGMAAPFRFSSLRLVLDERFSEVPLDYITHSIGKVLF